MGLFIFLGIFFLAVPKQSVFAEMAMAPSGVTIMHGPNSGEAIISWNQSGTVQKFALVFGTESNNYTMGAPSFPWDSRSYTVRQLTPGKKYFFRVWSFADPNGPATASDEVSIVAK